MSLHLVPSSEPLLTKAELADAMAISVPTLNRIRYKARDEGFPMPEVTWGRKLLRFRLPDVLAWWAEYERRSAA